jgi:tripeptidyl-peptidase-1
MMNATSGEFVRMLSKPGDDSDDGSDIITDVTPSILRELYKTEEYVPSAMDQNVLGILGFHNQYPSRDDLTVFMANYRRDAIDATYSVVQINGGGYDPSHPGFEANLDIQLAGAMAYPTPQIFYSTGGGSQWTIDGEPKPGDEYIEWFNYILNQPKIPPTISISYGGLEQDFPREYATAVCDLFVRLGARGASVLFGSGDEGVGPGDCRDSSEKVRFIPVFPASCTCGDVSSLHVVRKRRKFLTRPPRFCRSLCH